MLRSEEIEKVLREYITEYETYAVKMAYCNLSGEVITVESTPPIHPIKGSRNRVENSWRNVTRFFSNNAAVLPFFISGGGIAIARIDASSYVVLHFVTGAAIGVCSVAVEDAARAIEQLVRNRPVDPVLN